MVRHSLPQRPAALQAAGAVASARVPTSTRSPVCMVIRISRTRAGPPRT